MALARIDGENTSDGTNGSPPVSDASDLTLGNAGETQWGGTNSPWIFSSGLAPRLGYITGATVMGDDVDYDECDPALLPEGVACGEPLRGGSREALQ